MPSIDERFENLLPLVPGVVRGPNGRINMKGARTSQNGSLVNSADVTDPAIGRSGIDILIDVVSSIHVLSTPYDPEYGKFTGAVSNVETRSGDFNKFRVTGQNFIPRFRRIDGSIMGVAASTLPDVVVSETVFDSTSLNDTGEGDDSMTTITTKDGTTIFYKDWGPKDAQPVVFHHGWPLSADDWDVQMLFFLANGYRVVAHDRRGHGRSSQVGTGHDMDHYASDASAVAEHLDLRSAIHIGHSTGGGEVARYVAQYGQPHGRVAMAVLIAAVPPLMLKTDRNPGGTPIEVFDGYRKALAANRAQFYVDVASGPFYGFNRPGAKISQGIIQNWWRQGMIGSALAHYEGIKAFSETDQTEDLKAITVPTLILQGDDDQVVPCKEASLLQAKLLKNATYKIYPGFPHGMITTYADVINADVLAFIKGASAKAA